MQATFNITAGKSGTVKAHNVSYGYDNIKFQNFINGSFGTFNVATSNCPAQRSIDVSLTAVNVLGEGPPSDPVIIRKKIIYF